MNGAILGMRRAEIQRKFDEIVASAVARHYTQYLSSRGLFDDARVGKFIDTPL